MISEHLLFRREQQPVGGFGDYLAAMFRFRVSRNERYVRRITASLARTPENRWK
jgi:hypothetical protein